MSRPWKEGDMLRFKLKRPRQYRVMLSTGGVYSDRWVDVHPDDRIIVKSHHYAYHLRFRQDILFRYSYSFPGDRWIREYDNTPPPPALRGPWKAGDKVEIVKDMAFPRTTATGNYAYGHHDLNAGDKGEVVQANSYEKVLKFPPSKQGKRPRYVKVYYHKGRVKRYV